MGNLKYKLIKTEEQYYDYCSRLETLMVRKISSDLQDEIDLLTLLIEKWDEEQNTFDELDPIQLLNALMESNKLKSKDLVEVTGLTKGMVSKILSYQKGLSKETIRRLSSYFKISQEAFNRSYPLNVGKKAKAPSTMSRVANKRAVEEL